MRALCGPVSCQRQVRNIAFLPLFSSLCLFLPRLFVICRFIILYATYRSPTELIRIPLRGAGVLDSPAFALSTGTDGSVDKARTLETFNLSDQREIVDKLIRDFVSCLQSAYSNPARQSEFYVKKSGWELTRVVGEGVPQARRPWCLTSRYVCRRAGKPRDREAYNASRRFSDAKLVRRSVSLASLLSFLARLVFCLARLPSCLVYLSYVLSHRYITLKTLRSRRDEPHAAGCKAKLTVRCHADGRVVARWRPEHCHPADHRALLRLRNKLELFPDLWDLVSTLIGQRCERSRRDSSCLATLAWFLAF